METGDYFQMALLVLVDQCIKGNNRKYNQESYFNDITEILLKVALNTINQTEKI
jgi:hypothetical protein